MTSRRPFWAAKKAGALPSFKVYQKTIVCNIKTHINVSCTICPAQNLVRLVGIRLTLRHQVLDDVEAASLSGKEDGSHPMLDAIMQALNQ